MCGLPPALILSGPAKSVLWLLLGHMCDVMVSLFYWLDFVCTHSFNWVLSSAGYIISSYQITDFSQASFPQSHSLLCFSSTPSYLNGLWAAFGILHGNGDEETGIWTGSEKQRCLAKTENVSLMVSSINWHLMVPWVGGRLYHCPPRLCHTLTELCPAALTRRFHALCPQYLALLHLAFCVEDRLGPCYLQSKIPQNWLSMATAVSRAVTMNRKEVSEQFVKTPMHMHHHRAL